MMNGDAITLQRRECHLCNEVGALPCGGCDEFVYCGKEHKREHWDEHGLDCNSFKIVDSTDAGRYLIASRRVKAGKLLFSDDPIVVAPLTFSELTCLGCLGPIYEETFSRCPDCSWPMCTPECALKVDHAEECLILSKDTKMCAVPQQHGITPRYDIIMTLRCLLLRYERPSSWNLILNMVSHDREEKMREDPYHNAVVRYLTEVCKLEVDIEDIHHTRGAIVANGLEIRGPKGNMLRALYPLVRLINHSCIPNIHLASTPKGKMEARAAVDIEKGRELSITYTGTVSLRWERQSCLSDVHYFTCKCSRCNDPTELGSHYSSPKCPQCRNQYLLPQLPSNPDSWACRKCKTTCNTSELIQEIDDWLFRMEMNELFGSATPHKVTAALGQIERIFHNKHFLYLKASQMAIQKLKTYNDWAELRLKKDIWEGILNIYDILEPGLTRRRGVAPLFGAWLGVALHFLGRGFDDARTSFAVHGIMIEMFHDLSEKFNFAEYEKKT